MTRISTVIASTFALISMLAGCGSGGSAPAVAGNSDTGAIAATLTWSQATATAQAKTLYAAPAGITKVRISVYEGTSALVPPQEFSASAGSGTINGILAGTGRIVKAEGMDADGYLRYQGSATVNIVAGQTVSVAITMTAQVTTLSAVAGATANQRLVTLTTSGTEPATIYYTTNGSEPTDSSANGTSPVKDILIDLSSPVTVKFFSIVKGLREFVKSQDFSACGAGGCSDGAI